MQLLDKEKAKRNLEAVLEKLNSETDISLLNEYKKLYKNEISFFRRSWAAAWLFMYYDRKEIPSIKAAVNKISSEEKNPSETALTENESKRLFISVGKNRRLFPRDIITLIMSKTKAARDDIGVIRILDNYSFVQVRDKKADEIIEALNGTKFRGRTMTVNYAKPKTSDSETEN